MIYLALWTYVVFGMGAYAGIIDEETSDWDKLRYFPVCIALWPGVLSYAFFALLDKLGEND